MTKEHFGENHPELATSLETLSDLLAAANNVARAAWALEQCIRIRTAVFGETHELTEEAEGGLEELVEQLMKPDTKSASYKCEECFADCQWRCPTCGAGSRCDDTCVHEGCETAVRLVREEKERLKAEQTRLADKERKELDRKKQQQHKKKGNKKY